MATSHPYISGAGNITQMITQLRKNFPSTVNSDLLKKFQLAPNNESYVINALHFIGVIDEEGKKTERGVEVFSHHADEDFSADFKKLIETAYADLKDVYGDEMWSLDRGKLVGYFRKADKTSAAIGARQAAVFSTFAALSGHGEIDKPKAPGKNKPKAAAAAKVRPAKVSTPESLGKPAEENPNARAGKNQGMALTVRVEINLPAGGTKEDYDNIFKSIRENLLNE